MTIRTIRDGDQAVVVETTDDGRVSVHIPSGGTAVVGWNTVERLRRALCDAVLEQHLRQAQGATLTAVPAVDGLAIVNALRRHQAATVPG